MPQEAGDAPTTPFSFVNRRDGGGGAYSVSKHSFQTVNSVNILLQY